MTEHIIIYLNWFMVIGHTWICRMQNGELDFVVEMK